ncbi:unnamed protein product [Ilex paraguariensis]|uniref:D-aminoacyl-tRNA deacylase n=1 Tax=Ilex paraguariensis TaxID=185542 RepID=A0ABC8S6S0_9AQUA
MGFHSSRLPLSALGNPPSPRSEHTLSQSQTNPNFLQHRCGLLCNIPFLRSKRTSSVWLPRKRQNPKVKAMRAVVQRVASASVEVEGSIVSAIGPGLLVLVGLHDADVNSDADYICRKVLSMRLFPNEKTGKTWDQNVIFTLPCLFAGVYVNVSLFPILSFFIKFRGMH